LRDYPSIRKASSSILSLLLSFSLHRILNNGEEENAQSHKNLYPFFSFVLLVNEGEKEKEKEKEL